MTENERKRGEDPDIKKVKVYAVAAFAVVACSILFYLFVSRMNGFFGAIGVFFEIIAPILYGFGFAYVLNAPEMVIEKGIFSIFKKAKKPLKNRGVKAVRLISTLLTVFILLFVVYWLVALMIPELIRSIQNIANNLPTYGENIKAWLKNLNSGAAAGNGKGFFITSEMLDEYIENFRAFITDYFSSAELDVIYEKVTDSAMGVFFFFKNVFLGLIVSVYGLYYKESLAARFKRLIYAFSNVAVGNRILKNLRFIDDKFGGFLIGKIIDSAIIGVICYVGCLILQMPYTLLISFVIGLTNIIPFFGPFIGAIPTAVLVFCVDPLKSLYFIIFIFVLQQFDGNFLGPKILGNSVGVSSFMVLVAILAAGGLWGLPGMIVGVPLCAIVMAVVQTLVIKNISKKQLPVSLESYKHASKVDPWSRAVVEDSGEAEKTSIYQRLKRHPEELAEYERVLVDNPWDVNSENVEADSKEFEAEFKADKEFRQKRE